MPSVCRRSPFTKLPPEKADGAVATSRGTLCMLLILLSISKHQEFHFLFAPCLLRCNFDNPIETGEGGGHIVPSPVKYLRITVKIHIGTC